MATYKGTAADGNRARELEKQRDADRAAFAGKKNAAQDTSSRGLSAMDAKFAEQDNTAQMTFKASTVGLVTAAQFKEKKEEQDKAATDAAMAAEKQKGRDKKRRQKKRKAKMSALSFNLDDEEGADDDAGGGGDGGDDAGDVVKTEVKTEVKAEVAVKSDGDAAASSPPAAKKAKTTALAKVSQKNPHVDTTFLPDAARDAEEGRLRAELKARWQAKQAQQQREKLEVTFSYWDGSGHRRTLEITQGTTIERFLEAARNKLCSEFHELRGTYATNLMYIKEDLIIPHHFSFYDLIATKARGKSGPLFKFDVYDDIRVNADVTVAKDESHAGKIVTRAYYDRNKHIFPASRWEIYDPGVDRSDDYRIKG
jgi:protein FAM50